VWPADIVHRFLISDGPDELIEQKDHLMKIDGATLAVVRRSQKLFDLHVALLEPVEE
jgi:hypothetical protein